MIFGALTCLKNPLLYEQASFLFRCKKLAYFSKVVLRVLLKFALCEADYYFMPVVLRTAFSLFELYDS